MKNLQINNWDKSLARQLDLISWLQSKEGAIGNGVINSYNKQNGPFYGLWYSDSWGNKRYYSSDWAGWQNLLMERIAEYYYSTGDKKAGEILNKWVQWISLNINNDSIPMKLTWTGLLKIKL